VADPISCPDCGAPMGEVEPSDCVWGGWVCSVCRHIDRHPFTCLCGAGRNADRHWLDCPCWEPAVTEECDRDGYYDCDYEDDYDG
jgi:hypothetical protein